jgi:hypothetical protein
LQLSARPWLYELGKKYGRTFTSLRQIPDAEFFDIAANGYNIVWLMGVWELGPIGLGLDRNNSDAIAHYREMFSEFFFFFICLFIFL